ncbi:MAG TPA: hypothetical protein DD417_02965 [Elusimicrobia bacterium]|nr:hypothetical protein [Elusimicrobiota bacterium]
MSESGRPSLLGAVARFLLLRWLDVVAYQAFVVFFSATAAKEMSLLGILMAAFYLAAQASGMRRVRSAFRSATAGLSLADSCAVPSLARCVAAVCSAFLLAWFLLDYPLPAVDENVWATLGFEVVSTGASWAVSERIFKEVPQTKAMSDGAAMLITLLCGSLFLACAADSYHWHRRPADLVGPYIFLLLSGGNGVILLGDWLTQTESA